MRAYAVAEPARKAVALNPRLLSLRETMVLAGVPEKEKEVRNDISRGVVPAASIVRLETARLCFRWPDVVTFAAVYGNRFLDSVELRKVALKEIYVMAIGHTPHYSGASYLPPSPFVVEADWDNSLCTCAFAHTIVNIDNYLSIDVGKACEEVKPRVNLYASGLERVEENDAVLGGAAVFKGTRLSVLHIGKMAEAGESIENILEDYPNLTEGDVKFARLYYKARPSVGRPRSDGAANGRRSNDE
jgi:uncharacterized protein (DUF433 family)